MGDLEDVFGDLRRHDVAVVTFGDRDQAVRVLYTGAAKDVDVRAVPHDLVALEVAGVHAARRCARQSVGVTVGDDDLMPGTIHIGRNL